MEYTQEIEIALPRGRVVELFDDPENLPKWLEGLQSFDLLSGEAGQVGAKSRLVFKQGRRTIEMIETITRRDLPDAFDGTYEARGVHNLGENRFIELGQDRTKWVSRQVYEFSGWMKVVGLLLGRSFPKQTYKYMTAFKAFAERA